MEIDYKCQSPDCILPVSFKNNPIIPLKCNHYVCLKLIQNNIQI